MYENKQKNNEYAMKNFKMVDPEGNNYEYNYLNFTFLWFNFIQN